LDIRVKTPKGMLWCAHIKKNDSNGKVAAGSINNHYVAMSIESKKELKPALRMHIGRAHAILGHANEDATQKMAVVLNMLITRGGLMTCESCAIAKAKQMNVNNESEGKKAQLFNGQMFHDIAIMKEDNNKKKLCQKSICYICVDKLIGFKRSKFFVYKNKMPEYMCELTQHEMRQGYPIKIIQQDNAGENKKLISLAHSKEWKLDTSFKNMARKTPQQNLKAEMGFAVIAAKARAMLSVAQVPREEHHKMSGEVAKTATALDNLIAVTINGETKTRYEHAGLQIPLFVKHLRTFGKAGIVKNMKDGKVGGRGITMMFVGYAEEHTGKCYRMYNPVGG
jgi:hypothetical protein